MIARLVLACLLGVGIAAGCGAKTGGGSVDYSVSASKNYEKGLKELDRKDWVAASKYFGFIKSRFPYSKFAVLAELRLADAEFGAEQYLEAIDSYRLFIKFHPTHEMVVNGYASFRIGEAFFKQLPTDFWMVPPSFEKDQTAALDAARELQSVIRDYGSSKYAPKAKELYKSVAHLLAAHEWYVATFYWKRDEPMGTVLRLRTLLKQYPDVGYDEVALHLLGIAYTRVGRNEDAKKSFQTLVDRYPKHRRAGDARHELASLGT